MGKIRKFLGFFVFLVSVVFGANAFATGYVCDDIKKYTSCDVGYYLSDCGTTYDGRTLSEDSLAAGNSCTECPEGYTCTGGLLCPVANETVTVEYWWTGLDEMPTQECVKNAPCNLFQVDTTEVSRAGKYFAGWTRSSTNNTVEYTTTATINTENDTIALYAVWLDCPAGQYHPEAPGVLPANQCATCPSGSYARAVDGAVSECSVCRNGTTSVDGISCDTPCPNAGQGIRSWTIPTINTDENGLYTSVSDICTISSCSSGYYRTESAIAGTNGKCEPYEFNVTFRCGYTVDGEQVCGIPDDIKVKYNEQMPELSAPIPERPGYVFKGWWLKTYGQPQNYQYYDENGQATGPWTEVPDSINGTNFTLYAGWEPIDITITYAKDIYTMGEMPAPTVCKYEQNCELAPFGNTFWFNGGGMRVFSWMTKPTTSNVGGLASGAKTFETGSKYKFTEDMTLYPMWGICTFDKFNPNVVGAPMNQCMTCPVGSRGNASTVNSGCDVCPGGTTGAPSSSNNSACQTSCPNAAGVATWQTPTWEFAIDNDTGNIVNKVVNKCAIETCQSGYARVGSADPDAESSYQCVSEVDLGYYAINLNLNGGTITDAEYATQCNEASATITLPAIERTGYTFDGWYNSDDDLVTEIAAGTCDADQSFTAKWTQIKYIVTYEGCGTALSNGWAFYGVGYTPMSGTVCSKPGYTFGGWAVSGTEDIKEADVAFIWEYTENKTFTATWNANEVSCYKVTLDVNGGTFNTENAYALRALYKKQGDVAVYSDASCTTPMEVGEQNRAAMDSVVPPSGQDIIGFVTSANRGKSPIKSTTTISPVWQPGGNVLLGSSDVASDMTLYALYYVPCPTSVLNGTCSLDNIYDKNTGTLSLTYKTTCNPGGYLDGTTCKTCDANYYCPGGSWTSNDGIQGRNMCPGSHPLSEAGTNSQDYCYKQCESQMGRDYYNATDTCSDASGGYVCDDTKQYMSCNTGYYLSDCGNTYDGRTLSEDSLAAGNSCTECPEGYTCTGGLTCPLANETVTIEYWWTGLDEMPTQKCVKNMPCNLLQIDTTEVSQVGKYFAGWTSSSTNNNLEHTTTGTFDKDTTLYAVWLDCPAGQYHPKETGVLPANQCATCPSDSYARVIEGAVSECSLCYNGTTSVDGISCDTPCPNAGQGVRTWTMPTINTDENGLYTSVSDVCKIKECKSDYNYLDGDYDPTVATGKCEPIQSTLTFNCGYTVNHEEVCEPPTSVVATVDQPMPELDKPIPIRAGHTFVGWYNRQNVMFYDENGKSVRNWGSTPAASVGETNTLYAGWKPIDVTITYVPDEYTVGTVPEPTMCKYMESCKVAHESGFAIYYKDGGWYFAGWRDENGKYYYRDDLYDSISYELTEDVTVHPAWVPCDSAKFYPKELVIPTDECLSCPTGSHVSSYNMNTGCTVCPVGTTTSPGSNVLFTDGCKKTCPNAANVATWQQPTWDFSIDSETRKVATNKVTNKCTIVECEDGYKRVGSYDPDAESNYQCVSEADLGYYAINLNLNGGTITDAEYATQCNEASATITLPAIERTGYTFDGWYNSDDVLVTEIAAGTCDADQSFTAKWTEIVSEESVVINFDFSQTADGAKVGNGELPQQIECIKEQTCSLPQIENVQLYRDGYTFVGWCNEKIADFKGTDYIEYLDKGVFDADTTLYPVWQKNTEIDSYDILLDKNGGEFKDTWDINQCNVNSDTIILPTDMIRIGYVFDGWYRNGERVSTIDAGTCTASMSFVAQWTPCNYTVAFNANGGNGSIDSATHTYDKSQALTSNKFTRSGYGFAGWATSANGGVVYSDGESVKNLTDTCNGTVTLYAVWTKGQYKISYILNGGANYSDAPVAYDITTPTITLGTPTRANSVFDGWYTDATFTTKITEITTGSTGDKTLYAKWSCNDGYHMDNDNMCVGNVINLGWNNGGVGIAPTYPTSCTYGQSFTMPAAIVADGYVFNNWAVNNKSFNATESVICNRDNLGVTSGSVTIVAMWERSQYTVTYSCGDGTGTPPESSGVIHNQPFITSANTCSRDGYSFGGWQISGTDDIKMANETFNWTYASNKTLTAQWTLCSYTIEFNANGGNGLMASSTHFYDREVALPAYTFAREGYVFAGWATSNNGSVVYRNKQVVKNLTPACNGLVTLYAVWAPAEYSVTYLCGDGAATALPIDTVWYDMSYTTHMGDLCARDGYKFSGWMVGGTNDIKSGGESFTWTYASNKTLTAQWTPCSYTVKFNANGGSGSMQSATYTYDVSSALNKNTFVYDGHVFTGWNTLTNGTGMSYTDGQVIKNLTPICNGAVTLYAMWAQGQYKISYVLNGGANYSGAPIAYDITTPTITLGTPTRVNSVFGGWYTDATFTTKITEIPTGSIGDKTLYAKWSCMPGYKMNSYGTSCGIGTINIVWQNGGHGTTYIPSSNCLYGGSIFMPIEPYAPGYDFVGWSVNGQIFDQNQKLPCDVDTFGVEDGRVVATALWRPETYTISYNMDGGINPVSNPETYTAETPTITLSKPTKDGYVFKYWTNTVGKVVEKIESGSVGDIALKANWAIGTYKITYELNGGVNNTSNPDAYVFNKTPIVLKAPKRVGYTFDKWVGNYVVDNTIINNAAGDLEIVATWKPNIYTINLNKNNGYGNVVSSVKCTYDSGICELPSLSVLKRDGYVSKNKWCENADGTGNCYNAGANIDTNISETGTSITLYADWEPDVFKVELVAIDATINKTQTVYLKYATGWFKDSAAKTPIALINTNALPEKPGYEFAGYEHDGVMIVDANGELQLDSDSLGFTIYDSAANAIWEKSELKCAPGTEPDDNEEYCVPCQNRFDAMGNVAVSSWTKGCTIASCMYQGELYDLHDNECVQICPYDTYSDETGSMIWNDKTKRCERNCIEGFVRW